MSDLRDLKKRLAERAFAAYDKTLEAYYYCNHSKQSARLQRKLSRQWETVKWYSAYIEHDNKEDE